MAAIGRFQKGDEVFYAKVVDGEIFRLQGDVFGSPSFDRKPTKLKGVRTLTPVVPSKIICVGLNYASSLAGASAMSLPLPRPDTSSATPRHRISATGRSRILKASGPAPNH